MVNGKGLIDTLLVSIIITLTFVFCFRTGEMGFFAFDQSIVFDGAYRIIQGQVPYKDFLMPFGPVVFWIQAIFFKIFGINYFSYLLFSAFSNAIGAFCSILILRILFPDRKILSYIAGILTGIWFYPPFGTPWFEQTSFLFCFLGLLFILKAITARGHCKNMLIVIIGIVSALSILSKQNAGLIIVPLYPILLLSVKLESEKDGRIRNILLFSIGFLAVFALFFTYVVLWSNLALFLKYFFEIPSTLGFQRLFYNPSSFVIDFITGRGLTSSRLVIFSFLVIAFYFFVKTGKDKKRNLQIASLIYIYLAFYQNLFNHLTCNQDVNGFPFMGVLLGIGTRLSIEIFEIKPLKLLAKQGIRIVVLAGIVFSLCFTGIRGIEISLTRRVHDVLRGSKFSAYCAEKKLKNLRWGIPTMIENVDVTEQSIMQLIGYLKSKKENFFIFPDFTIFYGLIGVPSPQPILWFHKEWTYPKDYDSKLDMWIVNDLLTNNVKIVVIEERSFLGTEERLNDFPLLMKYIKENFELKEKFGIFEIYLKITF